MFVPFDEAQDRLRQAQDGGEVSDVPRAEKPFVVSLSNHERVPNRLLMVTQQPPSSAANVCRVSRDGPYMIGGDVAVLWADGVVRAGPQQVLCRCGHSGHKPFCDGTHTKVGFEDPGLLPTSAGPDEAPQTGRVTITPRVNGPLECNGPLTVMGMDDCAATTSRTKLCRCGGSHTKPFCDGTHKKIGFTG